MIPNDRVRLRRVKLASGEVRELFPQDAMPPGAELIGVRVPLLMQDSAMREFASFPRDSDSSKEDERAAQREHDRLMDEREGAYAAMKEDIGNGWKSEEQRAASPKKIASDQVTEEDRAGAHREYAESIANAWRPPLTIRK